MVRDKREGRLVGIRKSDITTPPAHYIMKNKIEAHGVKGMNSTIWRKTFKSVFHMDAWVEKHDAEVHAFRFVEDAEQ